MPEGGGEVNVCMVQWAGGSSVCVWGGGGGGGIGGIGGNP